MCRGGAARVHNRGLGVNVWAIVCVCVCVRDWHSSFNFSFAHTRMFMIGKQFWEKSNLSLQIFRFNSKLLVTNHPTPGSTARIHKSPSLSLTSCPLRVLCFRSTSGNRVTVSFRTQGWDGFFKSDTSRGFLFAFYENCKLSDSLAAGVCVCVRVRASKQGLGTTPKLRKVFTVV